MDLFFFFFLISAMGLILEREGRTLPRTQHREKRCSCENMKDNECVYFCHIGIVWVNTPSQVIPYGVGSLQKRLRRDVGRCVCRNMRDTECVKFCSQWYSQEDSASDLGYSARKSKERHKVAVKQRKQRQKI